MICIAPALLVHGVPSEGESRFGLLTKKGKTDKMTNSILRIAFGSLVAAGLMAYGQQPQDNPQPVQEQQKQAQPATPAGAPQAQSADQVFAALDANKDGKLSQEEFAKLVRDAKVSDDQTEFVKWDKNGDKSISMEEFKAGYPQH